MDKKILKAQLSTQIFPNPKHDGKTKLASVLVIIYGPEPNVLMIKKSKKLNNHAGEIAFPGGKWTEDDIDLLDTALRETQEEIGFTISRDEITGQLENVRTLNSGFTITPFVSVIENIPQLKTNFEVESVLHMPLIPLLQTLDDDENPDHKSIQEMYTFTFEDKIVWGASARILKNLVNRLSI
ncbi:MAG TPA: CoA pyrophosphatase [Nitrosopumilaceae archaeon]|nr:CoA pyrophosphatase [Nitrosopumilaceae archaeon]